MDLGPLSKEVGAGPLKLPVWGWAIAGVGGVLLARRITGGGAARSSSAADDAAADDGTGLFGGGYAGGFLAGSAGGAIGVPGGALDPGASTITDNNAWRIAAVNVLVANSYDAFLASTAVAKYLAGDRLTTQETAAIEFALRKIGPTPEPVPTPLPVIPAPTVPPPVKPPVVKPPVVKPPATPPPPPAQPVQQVTPYKAKPALAAGHQPFEAFVDFANSPNKGTWWLTNWGGIYAVGGAPFKGAPFTSRITGDLNRQNFVSIEPYGKGYLVHDNTSETGNYAYP